MKEKLVHCSYCGEQIEVPSFSRPPYSCGAPECERNVRDALEAERQEAHERVDQEYGYGY